MEKLPLIYKMHMSDLDKSVNFEHRFDDHPGMLEARYVRRTEDYFIVYLSSQTGCNQACRMCWLTATGQNKLRDTTIEEYWDQADRVLRYYANQSMARMVHFNFMARGEPLANKIFLENADVILRGLAERAERYGLEYKFLISTIFPKEAETISLPQVFKDPEVYPELYYSIYSTDPGFRKRWLPKAIVPIEAIAKLRNWQMHTGKKPKIHYAFIRNENDNLSDVADICDLVQRFHLEVNWNVVRYNPPVGHSSQESIEGQINYLAGYVRRRFPDARVRVIPRVGTDVQASCGTFLK